jgi:rod shape-determining protein MreC
MKNYLNHSPKSNLIIKHSFNLVFNKIETVFFVFLCVVLIITSKINPNFSNKLSDTFLGISIPVSDFALSPINLSLDISKNFKEMLIARKRNQKLEEELTKLQNFYIDALAIHQENKELKTALNFIKSKTENYKVATVIGISHKSFNQNILIDAGKNRGIKAGQIVTGNRGVVGRIAEVFDNKSRILMTTDSSSRIPILASKARNRGILAGNNSDSMEILYLPKNHQITVGDTIFTSGDGDTLPPGLLVGVVKEVNQDAVLVVPVENINNVNIVSIIDY